MSEAVVDDEVLLEDYVLELVHGLDLILRGVSGMDAFVFQAGDFVFFSCFAESGNDIFLTRRGHHRPHRPPSGGVPPLGRGSAHLGRRRR